MIKGQEKGNRRKKMEEKHIKKDAALNTDASIARSIL
jgi:hypothetical protein